MYMPASWKCAHHVRDSLMHMCSPCTCLPHGSALTLLGLEQREFAGSTHVTDAGRPPYVTCGLMMVLVSGSRTYSPGAVYAQPALPRGVPASAQENQTRLYGGALGPTMRQ